MKDLKLTKAEKEVFEAFRQGGWKSILIPEIKKYDQERRVGAPVNKNNKKVLTIQLAKDITKKLKVKAEETGVAYQDLAVSVLQKFANSDSKCNTAGSPGSIG